MHADKNLTEDRQQLLSLCLAKKGIVRGGPQRLPRRADSADADAQLSFAQQRLWLLDRLDPGAPTYNIPIAVRIDGALDVDALERALAEIVRRHEVLRTTFAAGADGPLQRIAPAGDFAVRHEDLSALDADARELALQQRIGASAGQRFDLAAAPPLGVTLLRCAEQAHVLLIAMHHIVADGWSLGVLLRELGALYGAYDIGRPSPLPELTIQYADYAAWERAGLTPALLAAQLDYWRGRLAGAPALSTFPTDKPRGAAVGSAGASASATLAPRTLEQLRRYAAAQGVTPFMVFLAAFKALIARYSGTTDIVVGTPVWNREHPDVEPLIGFFVNTLVLRTDLSGDPSFDQLLERVKESALGAFAHSELPFEQLVDDLGIERHPHEVPLLRMMFTLSQERPAAAGTTPGQLTWHQLDVDSRTAKFDITMNVAERGDDASIVIEYKTGLFEADTMERLLGHFQQLLDGVAERPQTALSRLPLLTAAERDLQLRHWNGGAGGGQAADVRHLVETQAALRPDALALADDDQSISYGELDARANRLARALRARGVGRGQLVAIAMQRSADMAIATLAIMKAGAAFLTLDLGHPAERVAAIVADAGVALLLTRAADAALAPAGDILCLDGADDAALIAAQPADALPPDTAAAADDLAYVVYTSGSTGQPKGVEVTHGALANLVDWQQRAFAVTPADRASQLAGAAFDATLIEWWAYLCAGASVHVVDDRTRLEPARLIAWLAARGITVAFMPTPLLEASLDEAWPAGMALRALLVGGAALRRRPPAGLPFTLYNLYGPTENAVVSTWTAIGADGARAPAIGRPVDGVEVYVLDAHGAPVPAGVAGELHLGGRNLARGYRTDAALTAERFVPHPFNAHPAARLYRSGDQARFRADGTLEFLGRADDQVKIRGARVEPGEVEHALYQVDGIRAAAVLALRHDDGETCLAAYIELRDGADLQEHALRQALRQRLPSYMVPARIVPLPALPLTSSGKIDKAALAAMAPPPERDTDAPEQAPATPLQHDIAAVWQAVLKIDAIGVHRNFFDLGGNSLLAMQIVNRLTKLFGRAVPLQSIFDEPTIAGLAAAIERDAPEAQSDGAPPLLPADRAGPLGNRFQQSFAQQRLWFLEQLDPHSTTYNVPQLLLLDGDFDADAFQGALDDVVARHESLRTTFSMALGRGDKAGAVQTVAEASSCGIHLANLETLPEHEREARARKLLEQEVARPFDVVNGPVLRVNLIRLAARRHLLLINMHHLVTDAWSMGIFMRELSELYAARRQGRAPYLPALAIQYADFALWQKDWLQFGVLEEMLYHWQSKLQGAPAGVRLPADAAPPALPDDEGGLALFSLGKELSTGLRQLAFGANATPFMVLLAGFKAVLARYSGQYDIVIGTPVAGRGREEIEHLIGFFVNTLVLRTDLGGDPAFSELLARVRQTALDAFAHQELPYERLVERLEPERRWGKSPLFNMMFVLQNAPDGALALDDVRVLPVDTGAAAAKFDLTLSMYEGAHGFEGAIEYRAALFDPALIERLAGHFRQLLAAAVAQPQTPLSLLPLLTADERELQLRRWSRADGDVAGVGAAHGGGAADVRALIEAQAAQRPDALALVDDDQSVTYGELDARANRLARALKERGVRRGQLVAIAMQRSADMAIAALAAMKAGAAFLTLDLSHPAGRLAAIVDDGGAALILTRDADAALAPPGHTLCVDGAGDAALIAAQPAGALPAATALAADDLAYVIYTSGSTGKPKGVEVTHGALANLVDWQCRTFAVTAADRASQLAGAGFDAALVEWWANLCAGASVHVVDEQTRAQPARLIAWLAERAITIAFMPTPLLEASLGEAWPDGMPLRALFVGGAALRRRPPAGLPFKLYNMYGPTENTVVSTWAEIGADGEHAPVIGRPVDGVEVYVLDAHGVPVPAGVAGELYLGGRNLARGYRHDAALTAERFVPHPFSACPVARLYRSGDQVRFRADGTLEFLGRDDDQVKLRGYRVELGEIEHALLEQPGVAQATTVVVGDHSGEQRVAAYVVLRGDDADAEAGDPAARLREALSRRLPGYMVPGSIDVLAALPLTPNGKIDRRALPAPSMRAHDGAAAEPHQLPRTEGEKALVRLWAHLLDYAPVRMEDNFFQQGGHSLLALQLKSGVREEFGVDLSLSAMLAEPTPASLMRQILALRGDGDAQPLAVAAPKRGLSGALARSLGRIKSLAGGKVRHAPALLRQVLVPLNRGGDGAPLFLVHPVGGGVSCYAELGAALPAGRPLYGLQAPPAAALAAARVEDLAALYIAALRTVQPQGPYRVGGWSVGGVVAFEIGQQLQREGERVDLLALLDSFPADGAPPEDDGTLLRLYVGDWLGQHGQDGGALEAVLAGDDVATLLPLAYQRLRDTGALPAELDQAGFVERWNGYRAIHRAWRGYVARPYAGRLSLVMAADSVRDERQDIMAVWAPVAGGGLRIEVVPGDHYSVLRAPALGQTAATLTALLGATGADIRRDPT
ncbi:amino acid adenylation domain-containing protein [Oxalobacteraceae bacterium OTU3REALA1]|nr:amino acid adenylation domain-containing protein [Oxalobacteraceae bacterium OTU3REALA1]